MKNSDEKNVIKQLISKQVEKKKNIRSKKISDDLQNVKEIFDILTEGKTNHLL